jgi:hypothetical protein
MFDHLAREYIFSEYLTPNSLKRRFLVHEGLSFYIQKIDAVLDETSFLFFYFSVLLFNWNVEVFWIRFYALLLFYLCPVLFLSFSFSILILLCNLFSILKHHLSFSFVSSSLLSNFTQFFLLFLVYLSSFPIPFFLFLCHSPTSDPLHYFSFPLSFEGLEDAIKTFEFCIRFKASGISNWARIKQIYEYIIH